MGGQRSSEGDLIPGLQRDLVVRCLAHFSCFQHRTFAAVSRSWRNLVQSGHIRACRKALGFTQPSLLLLLEDAKSGILHLVAYEPETLMWRQLKSLPRKYAFLEGGDRSEAVAGFGCVVVGGQLFLIGGFDKSWDGTDRCRDTVYRYDIDLDTWQQVASMHTPRFLFACGVAEGRIFVAGGIHIKDNSHVRDRTLNAEVYEPQSNTWQSLPDTQLHRVRGPDFGFFLDDKFTVTSEDAMAASEAFDRVQMQWTSVSIQPLPDRPIRVVGTWHGAVCVLQDLWPSYNYRVSVRDRGTVVHLGSWGSGKPGPVAHPRELAVIGDKLFMVGNEHPRAIRKRHGYQGANAVQLAVCNLGLGGTRKPGIQEWKALAVSRCEIGSWVMGCAVVEA